MKNIFASLLMISPITIVLTSANAMALECAAPQPSAEYRKLETSREEKIVRFAQMKPVAQQADVLLGKLISAKSPVIMTWFKARNLEEKSEEEIAKTWRDYFARHFALAKYPSDDKALDQAIENLMNELNKEAFPAPTKKRFDSLFTEAKTLSEKALSSMPLAPTQKDAILKRVRALQLYWMDDFKNSKFKNQPQEFFDWGIAYDPGANEINMGVQALRYPDDDTIISVFAHEIGHAFDSCRWGAFFDGAWPFQSVGECLRGKESAEAKTRDDSRLEDSAKKGLIKPELAAALKSNPTCNKTSYPPPDVQADQLPESFADWFSAEAVATREREIKTLRSDLCENRKLNPGSSYPSNEKRLERIYFAQPNLRKILKLSGEAPKYCALPVK